MSRTGHEFDIDKFLWGHTYSTWYQGINPEGSRRLPPPAVTPLAFTSGTRYYITDLFSLLKTLHD